MTHPRLADPGEKKKKQGKIPQTQAVFEPSVSMRLFFGVPTGRLRDRPCEACPPACPPAAARSLTRILSNPHGLFDVVEPGKKRGRYR